MQFDHRPQQILCGGDSLRGSYLPNSKLSISLLNRQNRIQADSDDDKKPAGRWAKVDGKWSFVKDSGADDTVKARPCSPVKKQSVSTPSSSPKPTLIKSSNVPTPSPSSIRSPNAIRNDAAKNIQKIVRGYRQRLHFRVMHLQHKLDTAEQRTAASLADIRREIDSRKEKYYNKMMLQAKREIASLDEENQVFLDTKKKINKLRNENKQLRMESKNLRDEMIELKASNENLEKVNDYVADTFSQLQDEVANMQKAHDTLQAAIPEYRDTVDKLTEESDLRHQYIMAEQGVKLRYMKVIGQIVESVQDECKDAKLVDEVVGLALEVDSKSKNEAEP